MGLQPSQIGILFIPLSGKRRTRQLLRPSTVLVLVPPPDLTLFPGSRERRAACLSRPGTASSFASAPAPLASAPDGFPSRRPAVPAVFAVQDLMRSLLDLRLLGVLVTGRVQGLGFRRWIFVGEAEGKGALGAETFGSK